MTPVKSVRDNDEQEFDHRVYRRSSATKTPTSLIELLIGIFDTFYVTAKREERKVRQRNAVYPQLIREEEQQQQHLHQRYY